MAGAITILETSKGNACVIDSNNYCYYKNNYKPGYKFISWLCKVKGCNARVKTTLDNALVGPIPDNHSHLFNNALKRKAVSMENNIIKKMALMPGVQLKSVLSEISSNIEVRFSFIINYKATASIGGRFILTYTCLHVNITLNIINTAKLYVHNTTHIQNMYLSRYTKDKYVY